MNSTRNLWYARVVVQRLSESPCSHGHSCGYAALRQRHNIHPQSLPPRPHLSHIFPNSAPSHVQSFSTTQCLLKKGAKAAREAQSPPSKSEPADDPFDFTTLDSEIAASVDRLKKDLSKLRAGGRFNPENLEVLRVQIDKNSKEKARLSDVAQVIPKSGRVVHVLVGEKEHVKPTSTAILSSNLSLTPQPDPGGTNPLLLVINIPPPTAESRKAVVDEAVKAGEKATVAVRDARAKQHKKHREMGVKKVVRPDDLKKAEKQMEAVVVKGLEEVKRVVAGVKKVLEGG